MRVLGLLFLLVIGLGLGFSPGSAIASPCPFHTHEAAAAPAAGGGEATAPAAAVGAEPVEAALSSGPADLSSAIVPPPVSGHAVPEGQFCCHAAPAVAPAFGPALPSRAGTGLRVVPRAWLPPRSALAAEIYRPPASA